MMNRCSGYPECSRICFCDEQPEFEVDVCATCNGPAIEGTDACLTCLVAACIQWGCGAFIGSVEGGEVVS